MFEKYTEANCSTDIECEIVRIFDLNPTYRWPPRQVYLVVGGYPIERMPYVEQERKRPRFLTMKQCSLHGMWCTDRCMSRRTPSITKCCLM